MPKSNLTPEVTLIKIRDVLQMCSMSKSTIYAAIKKGAFPAPIKLSARSVAWIRDDIRDWIETRIRASRQE